MLLAEMQRLRRKLAGREALTRDEQIIALDAGIREHERGVDNMSSLVTAREAYDKLVNLTDDHGTHLSATFLGLLAQLGVALGHGKNE